MYGAQPNDLTCRWKGFLFSTTFTVAANLESLWEKDSR